MHPVFTMKHLLYNYNNVMMNHICNVNPNDEMMRPVTAKWRAPTLLPISHTAGLAGVTPVD